MSTLTKNELNKHLDSTNPDKLKVSPILNKDIQIDSIGIDIRLGNQFIVIMPENLGSFDTKRIDTDEIRKLQKEIVVPFNRYFVLHPQSLVLGASFEFISMPKILEGSIEGRSSWARIGLIIATATSIDPGFKGCITLELANISNIPLKLYPGIRIEKLICREVTSSVDYDDKGKKYHCPIGPEFSKAHLDKDSKFFFEEFK